MFVIKYKKIFFWLSGLAVIFSILAVIFLGLNFGIDFRGGSMLEIKYIEKAPTFSELQSSLNALDLKVSSVRASGADGFIIRTGVLSDEEKKVILETASFAGTYEVSEERFSSVGPIIGAELKRKAVIGIGVSIIAIIFFIAFAFRKVSASGLVGGSNKVSSWKYGLAAIIALAHDIIIPVGIFSILGFYLGAEVDVLFVMALLAILGFSVNDTIVVFDRVRENLLINQEKNLKENFEDTVGKSLSQTYTRSINTSLTTFLVLIALYILGGDVTQNFTLVLITGVVVGTYSSIFLASPLLVVMSKKGGN